MIVGRFPAMGTHVDVWAPTEDGWELSRDSFAAMEGVLSRFRPDSELSRMNRDPRPGVRVSPLLGSVLEAAARVRDLTGDLVDIAVGGPVAAWGYDRTFAEVGDRSDPAVCSPDRDWNYEPSTRTVARAAGVVLDFGGVGKGWTADWVVEAGLATVVAAGGDIRSIDPDTVVPVDVGDGVIGARVVLGIGALATSSTLRRSWKVAGRQVSHLIDPRTGAPVESPVVTATALAASAVEAEAAAKAVLILGEDGLAWAAERPWVKAAMVVWNDGSIYSTRGLEIAA